jgi:hypothetical protein
MAFYGNKSSKISKQAPNSDGLEGPLVIEKESI